ncbi:hypothetical protein IQ37_06030 [Chryseobacterium piperi]|uniref:C1q domain-containing protein n=1 Tax=Chryseobacterium piperi TaxID=558152 RepID=A0A086BK91_9FLAO|nr:hypothetical protein [Chryseobacterium piperi]ASW76136.1 hypothetical protein CJF12_18900 [Chryseobacterium piperi]KFF29355.1 hypothetical protein IQ37_06030 [Chryseobacterium piperi]
MKTLIIYAFLLCGMQTYAQVGINTTTPDPSAVLDIRHSNKGLLIPRVNLVNKTDLITIPNPANGLLVYNLSNSNSSTNTNNQVIANNFYTFSSADNSWKLLVTDTVLNDAIEGLGVTQLQVVANASSSGNDVSYAGNDLGANIRKLFFTNKVFDRNNTYDAINSEFKAPKNGYYQIDASILLKSYQSQNTTNIVRLGVSKPYTTFTYNGNATFAFLNQPLNAVTDAQQPLTVKVSGVIYMNKDEKICFLTRYITPGTTSGDNIYSMSTESLGYNRAQANNITIIYLPITN